MGQLKSFFQVVLIVLAGVASYLLAVRWAPGGGDDDVVEAVTRPARPTPAPAPVEGATGEDAGRDPSLRLSERDRSVPKSDGNAFAVLSWLPPPPPPPVRVAPPPPPRPIPVAPPLPFTFVGMMEKGGPRPQAFIAKGDALLIIGAGDTIDNNTYRVDVVDPQKIVLTYLPLNTAQTLTIRGATK